MSLIYGTSDDTPIWRYMSFSKFESMLDKHALWFTRPFKFDDKWEGLYPPSFFDNTFPTGEDGDYSIEEHEDFWRTRADSHRYANFVSCWHLGNSECDAMWRLYGLAPEGIAIKSTISRAHECLWPHHHGIVQYYDPSQHITGSTFSCPDILMKREDFSWEREYRLWFSDDKLAERIESGERVNEKDLSPGDFKHISELPKLITSLVVAPGASQEFIDSVKDLCKRHNYTWLANLVVRSHSDRPHSSFFKSLRKAQQAQSGS